MEPNVPQKNKMPIKTVAKIGVLGAIATILMLFEIPLWFAPSFYEIDLSEVVVMIGGFALGPIAGVFIELIKILLNLLLNGTVTAGVGELANFVIGCAYVLPAAILYRHRKSFKNALIGMAIGTVSITAVGALVNLYVMLPAYVALAGFPMEALIGMGTAVNPAINSVGTLVLFATVPFNLIKGVITSLLVGILYKRLSPILHK